MKGSELLQPSYSPWGEVDWSETLCPGFEMVATPSHGGIMVERTAAMRLSVAARKCGQWDGGYLCFEEDCAENVVLRELLDKGMWQLPQRIRDPDAFEEAINKNVREYNPEYWSARQRWYRKREQAKQAEKEAGAAPRKRPLPAAVR